MVQVLIVGGGIAGTAAAISLRRAGHTVKVYEKSATNDEIGAAVNVPPNATRFLVRLGIDPAEYGFVRAGAIQFVDMKTLASESKFSHELTAKFFGAPLYYAHRVDLHGALKKLAVDPAGAGTPVEVHLNSTVVAIDPYEPSITLASGETIRGDVIVGADGLHSVACTTVLGYENKPIPPSHYNACYRFLIPAAALEEDPETKFWNNEPDGVVRVLAHEDTSKRIVSYRCRDGTIHNFVGLYYDESMKTASREDYLAGVDKDTLLATYTDINPGLRAVINKATEIKRWPLLYRKPLSNWRRGKLVLLGDAAHPMLPHQGQGAAQGMEDGIALGIILCGATSPEEIETRLDLYQKVRRTRASVIQIVSNVGQDQSELVHDELRQFLSEDALPRSPEDHFKFNFGPDVAADSVKAVKELDPSFELPAGFFPAADKI